MNKFNEKYSELNESELLFVKNVINCNDKQEFFNDLISENLLILKSIADSENNGKITKTIERINEMKYNDKTFNDDILKLYELRMGII